MANFLLVYHGGGGAPSSPEEGEKVMKAWMDWFGSLGAAVVDGGNPASGAKVVGANGVTDGGPSAITGYSVIAADSLDAAAKMAKGCPVISDGGTVEVVETFNAM